MTSNPTNSRLMHAAGAVAVFAAAIGAFWRTAYPTINWWDASSYSLAAATFGITSSPGSLMLTLLGWVVTRIPFGLTTARVLALFAGVLAATAATVIYLAAVRLIRMSDDAPDEMLATTTGAAVAALVLAFGRTLWQYATQFTPYILTAVFTALILLVMLRWWESADNDDSWRWLALLAFLFGLDFSVHRTNALLLPAVLGWILIRRPGTLTRPIAWVAGVGGLVAGLTLQLAVMPIAAHTQSPMNMFEPSTWLTFWDYVSLAQTGGGFLVELWPRKSGFITVQVGDFVRALRDNLMTSASPFYVLGWLPAFALVGGLVVLWRRNAQLGAGVTLVVVLHAFMTVLYFNIPADYFRSLDRHYLPVLVTLTLPVALGMQAFARAARRRPARLAVAAIVLALAPAAQLSSNFATSDASKRYFAHDFAVNLLEQLPPNAILFTVGDNDTFPTWYVQTVERVRPDVQIVNTSLANTAWYLRQIVRRDPTFPIHVPAKPRHDVPVTDSARIPAPASGALGVPGDVAPTPMTVWPTPMFNGSSMLESDWVLLDIITTNAWRRPITVAITAGRENIGWLQQHARLDGLFWRIVPAAQPAIDRALLRANVIERPAYRGYASPSVRLENESRTMGVQSYLAAAVLLEADRLAGDIAGCRAAALKLLSKMPPARLELPEYAPANFVSRCDSR